MDYFFCLILGLGLSFLGQLPLGTMSMTATQIAVQESFANAWKYSLGVALVEMIYLRLVLYGMNWILSHATAFLFFSWLTVLLFIVFGVLSFRAALYQPVEKKALLLENRMNRFLLGAGMSALNPAQIPFWFIWSGYFISQGWLKTGASYFNIFTTGSAIGTVGGLVVYTYGGNWLVKKLKTTNRTLNKIMGIIFIVAAVAQLYRIINP